MTTRWVLGVLLVVVVHGLYIQHVQPPTSPLAGGIEIYITGTGLSNNVSAEFGVNPGVLVAPKSIITFNGTLTASFLTPPRPSNLNSTTGNYIRLTDGQNWTQSVPFFWEERIAITNANFSKVGFGLKFQITGWGFVDGLKCTLPYHPIVKAVIQSNTSLTCSFPTQKSALISQVSVITPSGLTETFYLVKILNNYATAYGGGTLVFAWSGAVDRQHSDFVAIVDAMPTSPTYRQIVATADLPDFLAVNNEPHHMQLINNQTVLVAGGVLSLITRPQELFFWDITDPLKPRFLKAENPPSSAVDDIFELPDGGFIVSIMGAPDGSSPGAIGEWDKNLNFVAEYPPMDQRPSNLNPHGISIRKDLDLLVTSDFLDPRSTLKAVSSAPILRDTVRIWHPWSQRKISKTIQIPQGKGLMEIKLIPNDPNAIAYVTNWSDQGSMILWGIKSLEGTIFQALNLSSFYKLTGDDFMLHQPNTKGNRYIMSNPSSGWLIMLDTTDASKPVVLDAINFGANSGLHSLDLSSDDQYIAVSGYFLEEDNFGYIHYDGDRMIHIVQIGSNQLIRTDFNVDMNLAGRYPMRPHMIRFYNKSVGRSL